MKQTNKIINTVASTSNVQYPLVSVILPVYNVEEYLCKCVDSVLAQTYRNLEVILVDDGSMDNSSKLCEEYAKKDNRIKVIHQKNGGLSAARNTGIKIAKGKFLSFVDSDDWVAPRFIELMIKTIQEKKVDICAVGYFFVDPDGIKPVSISSNKQYHQVISSKQAIYMGFESLGFYAWNKLYARHLFKDVCYPHGRLFEDTATTYKLFLQTDTIALCDEPLYYYNRLNVNSIMRMKFSVKKLDLLTSQSELLAYAQRAHETKLIYIIKQKQAYAISSFFRQMAVAKFNDPQIVAPMQNTLRRNIGKLLLSKNKLSNKLFALVCCIDFNLAANIYRKIFSKDICE